MIDPSKLKDLLDLMDRVGLSAENVRRAFEFSQSRYFYDEALLKHLLWRRDMSALPRSAFINYPLYLQYYDESRLRMEYRRNGQSKTVELPYKVEVDLSLHRDTRIHVESYGEYKMAPELVSLTEENLRRYLDAKKKTTDGPILRVAHLQHVHGVNYHCRLESSTYWKQSRTNLTLDLPLSSNSAQTLRILDLGPNKSLRALHDSLLVNSLGVSGVLYFVGADGRRRFFMKLRKDSEGVFESMLGTTSGVVEHAPGQSVPELISYATSEMRREFTRETGCDHDKVALKQIIPLAFCRELTRGGKPQMFFAIEIEEINETNFKALFRKSPEGLDEFVDGLASNRLDYMKALSPEFAMNVMLSLQYFAREAGHQREWVDLD